MTPSPKVTVAMPIYNGVATLQRAIDSVVVQTYRDFELLIIDDGSSDDSIERISKNSDPRIRLLVHEKNRGLAETRNHLVEESRGEYVAWLDQDDWAHPERLASQVAKMGADANLVLCGTWTRHRTEGPQSLTHRVAERVLERVPTDDAGLRALSVFRNPFSTSSTIVRRSAIIDTGLAFDQSFAPAEDFDIWAQISTLGTIGMIPKVLTHVTFLPSGASSVGAERQILNARRIRRAHASRHGLHLTSCEGELLDIACDATFCNPNLDQLIETMDFMDVLDNRNRTTGAFDATAFSAACSERLIFLANFGIRRDRRRVLKAMQSNPITRRLPGWMLTQTGRRPRHIRTLRGQ